VERASKTDGGVMGVGVLGVGVDIVGDGRRGS
jgi:hypothetical protein